MRFLVAAACFASAAALAQTPESPPSQYERDVATLHGAIASYRELASVCAELYPQTLRANRAAYQQWRFRYLDFHQEVERRFAAIVRERAGGDRNRELAIIMKFDDAYELHRQRARRDLLKKEEGASRGSCVGYPLFLRTEKADFEKRYSERVASMRSRPLPE